MRPRLDAVSELTDESLVLNAGTDARTKFSAISNPRSPPALDACRFVTVS
jgi:hypothetical protein